MSDPLDDFTGIRNPVIITKETEEDEQIAKQQEELYEKERALIKARIALARKKIDDMEKNIDKESNRIAAQCKVTRELVRESMKRNDPTYRSDGGLFGAILNLFD